MNNRWMELAMRVQSIAQAGLAYTQGVYDQERYEELRDISAEMLSMQMDLPVEKIKPFFCNEEGYQTPKVDTRAVIFQEDKILLVRENNGTWALPGGWCDVDESIASNVIKETREEAGLTVRAGRLLAVHDWRKHNRCNFPFGILKFFVECEVLGGEFCENIETTEIRYFSREEIMNENSNEISDENAIHLAIEKTSLDQIAMCFAAHGDENWKTMFD